MTEPFAIRLQSFADAFSQDLRARLAELLSGAPERLADAVNHAALAGGKRIRPFLVRESARLFESGEDDARAAAFAVECLHTYSLVHDDLPAMDDDDMRRGRPTVHVAYDEATAILAGDCLLTLAFEFLAATHHAGGLTGTLARAAGGTGMVGGQLFDLAAEGRFEAGGKVPDTETTIRRIQAMKTGALIAASCEMGAIAAGAQESHRQSLAAYGREIGLAFQIADDLLDTHGDAARIGKAVGKDAAAGKATFVGLLGTDGARDLLASTVEAAKANLGALPGDTQTLQALADYIATRDH
ncbi:polyprenyl synthetase family protein [Tepidamorphus sp. 3E244]|uniref:polyprenyl synthetase family protein n=1 Tax=Tepidamorphus sp. 3E244 TaxID=3385498 RepID=UPI0038FD30CF